MNQNILKFQFWVFVYICFAEVWNAKNEMSRSSQKYLSFWAILSFYSQTSQIVLLICELQHIVLRGWKILEMCFCFQKQQKILDADCTVKIKQDIWAKKSISVWFSPLFCNCTQNWWKLEKQEKIWGWRERNLETRTEVSLRTAEHSSYWKKKTTKALPYHPIRWGSLTRCLSH